MLDRDKDFETWLNVAYNKKGFEYNTRKKEPRDIYNEYMSHCKKVKKEVLAAKVCQSMLTMRDRSATIMNCIYAYRYIEGYYCDCNNEEIYNTAVELASAIDSTLSNLSFDLYPKGETE